MKQDNSEPGFNVAGANVSTLLDALPLPAFVYDLDDAGTPRLLSCSPAMKRLYPQTKQPEITALASAGDTEALVNACLQAFRHPGDAFQFHVRCESGDGSTCCYTGRTIVLQDQPSPLGIAILFDTSDDEAMHQLMASEIKHSALQTLVAGLVHDFRNVLTHIIGTTELLLFNSEDPEITHDLNQMLKSAEQGSDMLTRLQHMIRIPAEASTEQSEKVHLYASLPAMLELQRAGLPARIDMQIKLADTLPATPMAEPQVRQILLALISNAADAITQKGCVTVELSPTMEHRFNADLPALLMRVADDGIGIAREHLDEVTRPFWTLHDDPGKLGLGLAIVSRLVRLHGGRMDIQSRPMAGTTVSVLLPPLTTEATPGDSGNQPQVQSMAAPKTPTGETGTPSSASMQPWNILLVDDSPEVLQVHQGMLERMGHRVITALNGYDALNLYNEKQAEIDLLVTDFRMPGIDGVDLAAELRDMRPDLPVLMITAYGDADKLQQLHDMKIDLLDKPVNYARLEAQLLSLQQHRLAG